MSALERPYKAMGLEQEGIYSALHALTSRDEPVTVLPASRQEQGFAIPPRPDDNGSVNLNAERVASVMANTARVSSILGEIFLSSVVKKVCSRPSRPGAGRWPSMTPFSWHNGSQPLATA